MQDNIISVDYESVRSKPISISNYNQFSNTHIQFSNSNNMHFHNKYSGSNILGGSQMNLSNNNLFSAQNRPVSFSLDKNDLAPTNDIGLLQYYQNGKSHFFTQEDIICQKMADKQKQQHEPKTRNRRMNIPKTTLIDRKTGEEIVSTNFYSADKSMEIKNPQDRDIIRNINRFLILNQFKYNHLLGRENNPKWSTMDKQDLAPRDGQFPQVWAIFSPQMVQNYKKYGEEFVHFVECSHTVKMVNSTMGFGLTPTNSRYFVFALFGLTKNLLPTLFGIGFASDKSIELKREEIYYEIIKGLIQANNPQMTEIRKQLALRKKKKREAQEVLDYNCLFSQILFCKNDKYMIAACDRLKTQFSIKFQLLPSFAFRLETMKARFIRHQLKKQKQILSRGQRVIKRMLQTNNVKQIEAGILELNQHNQNFSYIFRKNNIGAFCFSNFQRRYVGFHTFERYEAQFTTYLNHLVLDRGGNTLWMLLQVILKREQQQREEVRKPYEDRSQQMLHNARLRKLRPLVEPNVLHEIIETYKTSESLKYEKQVGFLRYIIGSDKRMRKVIVQFRHEMWKCECGYMAKIGIPCAHLMRVLHCEKTTKYEEYINRRHYRNQEKTFVQLND